MATVVAVMVLAVENQRPMMVAVKKKKSWKHERKGSVGGRVRNGGVQQRESPCKFRTMKGFEQKSYLGLKAASYNVRINPFRRTEVSCQLQKIDSSVTWPVIAHEEVLVKSKPAEPVIHQPLLIRSQAGDRVSILSLCINISPFVAGEVDIPIKTMPGRYMLGWRHGLIEESPTGEEAFNDNGLVQRTVGLLKDRFPDLTFSAVISETFIGLTGVILNDETIHQLCKQAVSQARAGADVVCTSEMLDGRVGAVRAVLDAKGFHHMNPANSREALMEAREDEAEGADILMVKPALPSLDIIRLLKDQILLPIGACQVSGEYSMIKAAGLLKMIDEEKVMMESLICLRRAGADLILTYFALQAATILCGENKKNSFN
ncbi:hypothetical protein Bca4012_064364 [Brassica carinata]